MAGPKEDKVYAAALAKAKTAQEAFVATGSADRAALVTFLASGESGYITGEVVDINGGSLID